MDVYKWLVDLLPSYILDEYKIRKYNFLLDWDKIEPYFVCKRRYESGAFEKKFSVCKCTNHLDEYYVSQISTGLDDLSLKSINRYTVILKEIIISIMLNLLNNTIRHDGQSFAVCNNFVNTHYVTKNKGYYYTLSEELDITLETFIRQIRARTVKQVPFDLEKELRRLQYEENRLEKYEKQIKLPALKKVRKLRRTGSNEEEIKRIENETTIKLKKIQKQWNELLKQLKQVESEVDKVKFSEYYKKIDKHLRFIYFQVMYALFCADKWFKFRHNDLHTQNVMIQIVRDADFDGFTFIIGEQIYRFPKKLNYYVKIIDFNRSHIKSPDKFDSKNSNLIKDLFDHVTSFSYTLEGSVYKKQLFKKRVDLLRLHHGIPNKKQFFGIKHIIHNIKSEPIYYDFSKQYGDEDYYEKLLLNPYFSKYAVDQVDLKKLNPNYTFIFKEIPDGIKDEHFILDPKELC